MSQRGPRSEANMTFSTCPILEGSGNRKRMENRKTEELGLQAGLQELFQAEPRTAARRRCMS